MCLAVPGKIVAISGDTATVDYGVEKRTGKILEECYSVGDYVVIQGGFVIMKVEKEEAERALELYANSLAEAGE